MNVQIPIFNGFLFFSKSRETDLGRRPAGSA